MKLTWLMMAGVVGAMSASVLAHDFWIEASPARGQKGQPVSLAFRVGDEHPGEPVNRNPQKLERFVAVGPTGVEQMVGGRDGADPAGAFTPDAEGLWVIGYRGKHSEITLEGPKFESYLLEEGLDHIIVARSKAGQSDQPATEHYSRCAKAIVRVGEPSPGAAAVGDRALGLRCEIVVGGDPTLLKQGEALRARVTFEGKPVAGLRLSAWRVNEGATTSQQVRTDAQGDATFEFTGAGLWILAGVHMAPSPAGSGAQWESTWTSLTFSVE